ncbi:MAG TPA: type II secretion system F family protein [Candidatus Eremiobacteraeota bacterium]|nr:MAG: putative type II secretion system protein F [bacterium ADurb.Bin363]HPZ08517.1 type II secretion system F family protein [Candidatus Eremiobacteraeota bacterium]
MGLIIFIITGLIIIMSIYYGIRSLRRNIPGREISDVPRIEGLPVNSSTTDASGIIDLLWCGIWDFFWYDPWGFIIMGGFYKDLYLFTSKLMEMVKLNIPVSMAMEQILKEGIGPAIFLRYSPLKRPLKRVMRYVQSGMSLAGAMKKESIFFPAFYINLIDIGEKEENLLGSLEVLDSYLKAKKDYISYYIQTAGQIIITTVMTLAITPFLVTYILPTFVELFEGMDLILPLPTKILVSIIKVLRNPILVGPIYLLILTIIILLIFMRSGRLRDKFDWVLLKIPFIGGIIKNSEYITFCHVMRGLLKSWMSIDRALLLASGASTNFLYNVTLAGASRRIEGNLTETLRKTRLFDETFLFMVSLGEKTENLSEVFKEMAKYYETNYTMKIKSSFQLLEVILTFLIGTAVGGIIISIFMPMSLIITEIGNSIFR